MICFESSLTEAIMMREVTEQKVGSGMNTREKVQVTCSSSTLITKTHISMKSKNLGDKVRFGDLRTFTNSSSCYFSSTVLVLFGKTSEFCNKDPFHYPGGPEVYQL